MEIKYAKTFKERLIGLMFKTNIDYILCFKNCNSIHTFFMKENIDVVFANKNNVVMRIVKNVPKNKIVQCLKAYYVYEMPVNESNNYHLNQNLNSNSKSKI